MITNRQNDILNEIIQEYINSAEPVSSQLLEKKCELGICPATIRIEMKKLTDEGFLFQPYTSSGRIPTDKGYRFFVNNILSRQNSKQELNGAKLEELFKIEEILWKKEGNILRLASRLTKFLAEESSNLAILNLPENDFIFREGWEAILKEPEFEERDFVSEFTGFLKNLEESVEALKINSGIKIYIGKENPFPKSEEFSIISSKCYFPDEEEGTISLLGPKRMDYDRNIGLMNSLTKLLAEL